MWFSCCSCRGAEGGEAAEHHPLVQPSISPFIATLPNPRRTAPHLPALATAGEEGGEGEGGSNYSQLPESLMQQPTSSKFDRPLLRNVLLRSNSTGSIPTTPAANEQPGEGGGWPGGEGVAKEPNVVAGVRQYVQQRRVTRNQVLPVDSAGCPVGSAGVPGDSERAFLQGAEGPFSQTWAHISHRHHTPSGLREGAERAGGGAAGSLAVQGEDEFKDDCCPVRSTPRPCICVSFLPRGAG